MLATSMMNRCTFGAMSRRFLTITSTRMGSFFVLVFVFAMTSTTAFMLAITMFGCRMRVRMIVFLLFGARVSGRLDRDGLC